MPHQNQKNENPVIDLRVIEDRLQDIAECCQQISDRLHRLEKVLNHHYTHPEGT